MSKKQIAAIILAISLILLGGIWFYYSRVLTVNYLIPGVPYYGMSNLFLRQANTPAIASILTILGYWGDKRFGVAELRERFFSTLESRKTESGEEFFEMTGVPLISDISIETFFKENGYEVYRWTFSASGGEIKEIKKFVNQSKKIPVIVFQKESSNQEFSATGQRVVIGIFDGEKKVIVHDNLQGNNYEISYQDFEKMFTNDARTILAVWPSDKTKEIIKGPNYNISYPGRLEATDKLKSVMVNLGEAFFYERQKDDFEKANIFYKEAVNDLNFKYFPPSYQVVILSAFAHSYIELNQYDEVINVIKERVLPINHNLNEASPGWFSFSTIDRDTLPYYFLSEAYLKKGQLELALINYKEMKAVRDSIIKKAKELNINVIFMRQTIDELEKEISAEK